MPTVLRRLAAFAYAVLIRALAALSGGILAYGATGMFTSAGVMPPNVIVNVGALGCGLVALALWIGERRLDGLWPAVLIVAVPYALYAWGSFGQAECPPNHPPITSGGFSCAPVGTHAIAVVAPLIAVFGVAMFVRDIQRLALALRAR